MVAAEAKNLSLAELVLAAPDVDWDFFQDSAQRLRDAVNKVTLYASSTDKALLLSAKWNGAEKPRAGFILPGAHLYVLPDIETIDVTALGQDMFGFAINHDIPFSDRSTLGGIARLFRYGIHPPDDRSPGEILGVPEGSTHPDYLVFTK